MTNMTNPHYDDGICNNQSLLQQSEEMGGKCMTNMTNPHYDDGICNNQSLLQQSEEMQQSQGHWVKYVGELYSSALEFWWSCLPSHY